VKAVFFGGAINLFGFGLSGMEVLGFCLFLPRHCTFLRGVLWHFMCHGIVLCAAAHFFVPRGCFCAAALFCAAASALFRSNVINAMVLCFVSAMCCFLCHGVVLRAVVFFLPWHWQCAASAVFCAMALRFMPWCCFLCHSIVRYATLRSVLQHCACRSVFSVCVQRHCYL